MNAFRRWIKANGLRQIEVARALEVSEPEISRYCRAGFWPKKEIALRLYYFTGGAVHPMKLVDPDKLSVRAISDSNELRAFNAMMEERKNRAEEKRNRKRAKEEARASKKGQSRAEAAE